MTGSDFIGGVTVFVSVGICFCCVGSYIVVLAERRVRLASVESFIWLGCAVFFVFLAWHGVPFGLDIIRGKYGV